jgi:hypothetical protein
MRPPAQLAHKNEKKNEKFQNPNPCSRLSKQNPKRVKKMVTQPE